MLRFELGYFALLFFQAAFIVLLAVPPLLLAVPLLLLVTEPLPLSFSTFHVKLMLQTLGLRYVDLDLVCGEYRLKDLSLNSHLKFSYSIVQSILFCCPCIHVCHSHLCRRIWDVHEGESRACPLLALFSSPDSRPINSRRITEKCCSELLFYNQRVSFCQVHIACGARMIYPSFCCILDKRWVC